MTIAIKDGDIIKTFNQFFQNLLEKKIVDALLVPQEVSSGRSIVQTLVKDPSQIRRANPVAPVLLVNGAKLISTLTARDPGQKIGVVLRSCEIRALIELVKFKQASLDPLVIIGVDCLGTFEPMDYQRIIEENKGSILEDFISGTLFTRGYRLRKACKICEHPVPEGARLTLGLIGMDTKRELFLQAPDEITNELGIENNKIPEGRDKTVSKLISERSKRKEEVLRELRERFSGVSNLLSEFAICKRCYNCRLECPICYCRECLFLTPVFEHKPNQYLRWAERKGAIRLPYETLLYHLTRLNHMVTSCIGCGQCSSACPNDLPVFELFRLIGIEVQKAFEYIPGDDVKEKPPVATFREEELEPK